MPAKKTVDKPLLWIIITLVVVGFIIFLSASLGLAAKESISFAQIIIKQLIVGVIFGGLACFFLSKVHYLNWRKYSFWFFIISLILTLAVFIPGLGFEFGGAKRWLSLGPFSFQPAELLKISFILYFATWLTTIKTKVADLKYGLFSFLTISGIVSVVMLLQPDTDTLIVMLVAATAMYLVSGAKKIHITALGLIGILGLGILILSRPYIKERIITFLNPASDPLSAGYQIQQSLIAIGSGGFFGRGFGQSLQKFNFLPEPIGDSIFAVAAEEFGLFGASFIIILFVFLAWRGYKIAVNIKNPYGGLVLVGLITLIVVQSFMNIGAMLGVIPLSGLPLLFISHGGTALFFTLVASGIMLNISRYQKN